MRKWSVMLSMVLGLVAVGWALSRASGGDARGEFDAQDDGQVAHSIVPIRALEVINDKVSPSLALSDAQGRLWLLQQYGGDCVSRRELDGRWVTVVGTDARESDRGQALGANVQSPDSIAFAPDDTLYVADTGNHVIRALDLETGRIRSVAGDGKEGDADSLAKPESLLRTPDGALWFIAGPHRSRKVYRLEPGTGRLDVAYDPKEASLQWGGNEGGDYMADLAADAQGRIYVADNANMRLFRLDAWSGPPANPRMPAATVLAGNGTLGVLQTDRPSTNSSLGYITSLALDPEGQVYVYEASVEGRLAKLDASTGRFVTVLPPETWVRLPEQAPMRLNLRQARLRVGNEGVLYLADRLNHRVLLLTP